MSKWLSGVILFFVFPAVITAQFSTLNYKGFSASEIMRLVKTHAYAVVRIDSTIFLRPGKKGAEFGAGNSDSTFLSVSSDSIVVSRFFFWKDKYPKLKERIVYSTDGEVLSEEEFEGGLCTRYEIYNKKGNPLLTYRRNSFSCTPDQQDSLYLSGKWDYDSLAHTTEEIGFDQDGTIINKMIYRRDDRGDREELYFTRQTREDSIPDSMEYSEYLRQFKHEPIRSLKLDRKIKYHTDTIARIITKEYFDDSAYLTDKEINSYDKQWRSIKSLRIAYPRKNASPYISAGMKKLLSETRSPNVPDTAIEVARYSADKKQYHKILYRNGKKLTEERVIFNNLGDPLSQVEINVFGKSSSKNTTTYGYDRKGNNIEEVSSRVRGIKEVIRKIVYYQ